MTGKIATDNYGVLTYYLYILPADFNIIFPAKKSEAFALTPDYNRNQTSVAGINFNITYTAEPTTRFCTYNLLVAQIRNTAIHFITSLNYMAKLINYELQADGYKNESTITCSLA